MNEDQAKFEGWARVEVMGHQTHIGFVRTEAYGQAVMFRTDTPGAEEREYILESPEHIGFVRTEAYGQAVMFRTDTPGAEEREYILESPEHVDGTWTPAGATVKRAPREGVSVLVGAGSIYRIVPCTEAVAHRAIETTVRAELKLVALPEGRALAAAAEDRAEGPDYDEIDEEDRSL